MRRFRVLIIIILFLFYPVFASNVYDFPANLVNISNQLPKFEDIKCKFHQEKYLQNISKPLVSSGDFEFVENKGVYFYTNYPVKSVVDYTNKNYKQVNEVIRAISVKKYSRLEKEFNFYFKKYTNVWILGLKPKNNSSAYNFVSSITIEGKDYIDKICIEQKNGNKTVIWFTK